MGNTKHIWSLVISLWKRNPVYFSTIYISCAGFGISCDDPLSAVTPVLSLLIPVIAVKVPCCFYLLPWILSPFQPIPIAQVLRLAICIARGSIAETKTVRAAALAGLNRMFVQWLRALLEELDQRRSPRPGSRARRPVEQDFLKGSRW